MAIGGAVGAVARYGMSVWLPHHPAEFPWATFWVNLSGCALIGVVLVLTDEVFTSHPLLRAALAPGLLGGFTTFSAYSVETMTLLRDDRFLLGFSYAMGTIVCALAALYLAQLATRRTATLWKRPRP